MKRDQYSSAGIRPDFRNEITGNFDETGDEAEVSAFDIAMHRSQMDVCSETEGVYFDPEIRPYPFRFLHVSG